MHRDDLTIEKSAPAAREIDRRTIAKGVAWTVPVVIVATAAPAAAASGDVHAQASYNASTRVITVVFSSHLAVAGQVTITGTDDDKTNYLGNRNTVGATAIGAQPATQSLTLTRKSNTPTGYVVSITWSYRAGATSSFIPGGSVQVTVTA